jgi:hypothetical protein
MSNVAGTTGVAIGGDADFRYNSSTNVLTVGTVSATTLSGSLFGTSSWSNRSVTASYVTGSVYNSANPALSASYALTASYALSGGTAVSSFPYTGSAIISGSLIVTGSVSATQGGFTGSLLGTSSWASNAVTASYVTGSVHTSTNPALSASYALSSSYSLSSSYAGSSLSASFASTSSFVNTLNQNVLITGSLTVGASSLGANENTLVLGPAPAGGAGEGGQLLLQATGGTYTSASMLDNYQNLTRLLRGTNAVSDAVVASFNMHTKQVTFPQYNSTTAFTGTTLVGLLGFDSNGNLLTTTTGSGGGGTPVTITNNVDNYIITATGTANTINGESNLQFNGTTLSVTGNVTATSITSSGAVIAQANGAMYFRGGDDAELWDINVANTVGVYGQQDATVGSIKLGSGGGTISGKSGNIGIGTLTPGATLHIQGNVSASSFTGSISSSFLQGAILNSQLANSSITVGSTNISLGATSTTLAGLTSVTSTSFTGSLLGTSSWASNAVTASYLNNLNQNLAISGTLNISASTSNNALITVGDLIVSGTIYATASFSDLFFKGIGNAQFTSSTVIISGASAALIVTGSVRSSGGFTGSLFGTASYVTGSIHTSTNPALSSSYALSASFSVTASYALNSAAAAAFPYTGTAVITGSIVQQTGSAFFPTLNASESLAAGDWINISASFVRKASSTDTTKQCHGFVITAVSSGSAATIYYNGVNPALSGLTVGARYFLSASGAESVNAPTTTGQLSQEVGVAISTTAILTNIGPAIIT